MLWCSLFSGLLGVQWVVSSLPPPPLVPLLRDTKDFGSPVGIFSSHYLLQGAGRSRILPHPGFPLWRSLGSPLQSIPLPLAAGGPPLSGSSVSGSRGYSLSRLLPLRARPLSRRLGIPQLQHGLSPGLPPTPRLFRRAPKTGVPSPASAGRWPRGRADNEQKPARGSGSPASPGPASGTGTAPKKTHLPDTLHYALQGHFRLTFGFPDDPKIPPPRKTTRNAASSCPPSPAGCGGENRSWTLPGRGVAVTTSCGLVAPPFPAPLPFLFPASSSFGSSSGYFFFC